MKNFAVLLFILVFSIPALAQDNCQPMPGVQLANPKCQQQSPAANAIEWTFPSPDLVSINKEGRTFFFLSHEVLGERTTIGDDKKVEAALIYFTPKMIATFEVMQLAGKLKDIDWFMAFTAIGLSVKTRTLPSFAAKGEMFKMDFYFFKVSGGRLVAATVSPDRKFVIVVPAPPSVTG